MTTTTATAPRRQGMAITGMRPLVVASVAVSMVAVGAVAAAGLAGGTDPAYAALVGGLMAVGILLSGTFVVNAVAGLMPSMSLLVALLTYVLQVVGMGVAFLALSGSGLTQTAQSRGWLSGTVIACTAAWLIAQVWSATHARIPVYDLETPEASQGEDGVQR